MRTITILLALTFFSPLVFADEKSGNKLKVKINYKFKDTESGKNYEFQFKYDTDEWLHITQRPEGSTGIFLRRDEVGKFKAIVEKMLKFGDAVYKNQITGVKKQFEGEPLPKLMTRATYIDVDEEVVKPFKKTDVEIYWSTIAHYNRFSGLGESWDLNQLEELEKIFDEKQKEVFKKYDLLKALND